MDKQSPASQAVVFWVIWAFLLGSVLMYPFMLGEGIPAGSNADEPLSPLFWGLGLGSFFLAVIIRWLVLPRVVSLQAQLVPFVVGIAISETIVFYGLFLVGPEYPQTQLMFYILSFLGVAQFIPTFTLTKKFDPNAGRVARH